jgi:hypothetical protein
MLRFESATGWWMTTHPDHARLAAAFAEHWGNDLFASPEPRERVLYGIAVHDDGWVVRDANPQVTRQGKPSAFSTELVGKYSAFEEIDLADYLAVRDRAVRMVAEQDAYAALLVSMHTYNLLSERADRSTIAAEELPLLDAFLVKQKLLQGELFAAIQQDRNLSAEEKFQTRIDAHFRLLQATDNLSLLSCVNYDKPATLLHPLRLKDGSTSSVAVDAMGERRFRLAPYPLDVSPLTVEFPARHVYGKIFPDAAALQQAYVDAELTALSVMISA